MPFKPCPGDSCATGMTPPRLSPRNSHPQAHSQQQFVCARGLIRGPSLLAVAAALCALAALDFGALFLVLANESDPADASDSG